MAELDLVVLGDCNPDLLIDGAPDVEFGQRERIVEDARLVVGGSAAIAACAAARLGLRVGLVAVIGDDFFGRFMRESLVERGVDVSGLVVDREHPTGMSIVFVRRDDRAILTALGTIQELSASDVDLEPLRTARHLHVSSFFLQRRLSDGLPALLAGVRATGTTTSIDPNWDPREEWDGGLDDALRETDILFVNAEEAKRIAGEHDDERAARTLAASVPVVVVKRGSEGAIAVADGRLVRAPALRVDVVDTVGAGDSFDAGFIAGAQAGRSLEDSLALACACGSLSATAAGGTAGQPTLAQATA